MDDRATVFRAAWVIPLDGPPLPNGFVAVAKGKIVSVGCWDANQSADFSPTDIVDLGEAALIPSLINAHTHLEFSNLRAPLGFPGIEFTQWIREIIRYRKTQNDLPTNSANDSARQIAIKRGIAESYRAGVGCIGEIATAPFLKEYYRCPGDRTSSEIEILIFLEQLGRDRNTLSRKREELEQFALSSLLKSLSQRRDVCCENNANAFAHLHLGVSPHAPYSVHPELLEQVIEHAVERKMVLAMHLAETEAERELLENQTGYFVDLLNDLGLWNKQSFLPAQSFTDILQALASCKKAIIVHGNYLRREEIEIIAKFRDRMAVAYCPRTHQYFQHSPYPLLDMRDAGVMVAVGTDSRASNPDLNLFAELQLISTVYDQLSPLEVLEMGTTVGARALGLEDGLGNLAPGKLARLSVVKNPAANSKDYDWLLDDSSQCSPVFR